MADTLRIAVVIASSRPQRVGPTVADWVMLAAGTRSGATYELVDLADEDLPNLDEPEPASTGNYTKAHTRAWSEKVTSYDGFVFVTAEYNHGIPGQLKNALDFLYDEWADKAAGIVSYGSSSAGSRAAESLKPLLSALGIAVVREQLMVSIGDDMEDGEMAPRAPMAEKLNGVLCSVERWAGVMRQLR